MIIEIEKSFGRGHRKMLRAAIEASHAHAPIGFERVRVLQLKEKARHMYAGLARVSNDVAVIRIDVEREDYLDTMFHECYHLHQMSRGDLAQEYGGFRWKGFFIPGFFYDLFYRWIPFERQAVKYAAKMVNKLN